MLPNDTEAMGLVIPPSNTGRRKLPPRGAVLRHTRSLETALADWAVESGSKVGNEASVLSRPRPAGMELWSALLGFLVLQMAIAVGIVAATGIRMDENWKMLSIILAAVCLGFGAATLMFRRASNSSAIELETEYTELQSRSERLIQALDHYERSSHAAIGASPDTSSRG